MLEDLDKAQCNIISDVLGYGGTCLPGWSGYLWLHLSMVARLLRLGQILSYNFWYGSYVTVHNVRWPCVQ